MKIIALVNQKGGVGKTTLAPHLATGFSVHGHTTVVFELDPQVSAAEWANARTGEYPAVLAVPAQRLQTAIAEAEKIRGGGDHSRHGPTC